MIKLNDYNYDLPESLIAQNPATPAHDAKLLICNKNKKNYIFTDSTFINLPNILNKDSVIFFNNTKVYKARIPIKSKKGIRNNSEFRIEDGELFVYKIIDNNTFECLVADGKNYRPGSEIIWNKKIKLKSLKFTDDGILFEIIGQNIFDFLQKNGQMPLPPYIKHSKKKEKVYQTFFAAQAGSSAAPTASLHFTQQLMNELKNKKITTEFLALHVGLGTFKPIYESDITKHKIHAEEIILQKNIFDKITNYKLKNKKIVAVGTTMVRSLESLLFLRTELKNKGIKVTTKKSTINFRNKLTEEISNKKASEIISNIQHTKFNIQTSTKLFIYPGFKFKIVDNIITNFHLPKTTLLLMISAWMGRENLLSAYEYAKKNDYKFYSFGDGMLI